ncbi:MAG: glycosyltransferase [Euryarchaeota archaeon]|nr:glycosyltransferase [Euryarchaeota archaeon]
MKAQAAPQDDETRPLRVCMVTPFPPRHDGIATYSSELINAMEGFGHTVYVISHTDENVGGHGSQPNVFGIIDITKPDWERVIFEKVMEIKPDVVHLQHEYGLYANQGDYGISVIDLLFLLFHARVPAVITYHSVYSTLSREEAMFTDLSLDTVDAGIVHEEFQKIFLPANLGRIPNNVYVIPHGAKTAVAENVPDALTTKRQRGFDDKKVVLCMGWWEPNKRFEDVVSIWPDVIDRAKDAILIIAGDARPGSPSGLYYKPKLLKAVQESPARERIRVITGAFTPQEYDTILNVADFVVLPYDRASQSGNLAHAFALGKPAVVTAVEGLKAEVEASQAGATVALGSLEELKAAIVLLLRNDELRELFSKRAHEYVRTKIGWSIVARKHLVLYRIAMQKEQMKITPAAELDISRG